MGVLQSKMGKVSTSTGAITITLDNPTAGGTGLLVFFVGVALSNNQHISTITLGGSSDHWASQLNAGGATAHSFVNFWSDLNCASGQTSVVITPTGGSGAGSSLCWVFECDDLPLTGTLIDKSTTFDSSGFVNGWTVGATAATTQASERIFAVGGGNSNTTTVSTFTGPSSPWNNFQQGQFPGSGSNAPSGMAGYKDVSSTGTQSYVVTASSPTCTVDGLIVTIPLVATSDSGTVAVTTKKPTVAISGNVITSGTAAVTAKKPTAAISGKVITSGTVSATAKKPTVAISGNVISSGTAAIVSKKPVVAVTATAPLVGTAAVTTRKPATAISGHLIVAGTAAVTTKKPVVAVTATAPLVGTVTVTAKKPVISASGTVSESGSVSSTAKKPVVAITGTVTVSGSVTVTAKKPVVQGSSAILGIVDVTAKKPAVSITATAPVSGILAITARKPVVSASGKAIITGTSAIAARKPVAVISGKIRVFGTAGVTARKTEVSATSETVTPPVVTSNSLFIFSQL